MKLIDKDALVAEIEERINKEIQRCAVDFGYSQGCVDSMRNVLSFLDTLEVKEVDLEKEVWLDKAWDWIDDNLLTPNQQDKSRLYFEQFKKHVEGE